VNAAARSDDFSRGCPRVTNRDLTADARRLDSRSAQGEEVYENETSGATRADFVGSHDAPADRQFSLKSNLEFIQHFAARTSGATVEMEWNSARIIRKDQSVL
jgi:hypothetical protein